MLTENFMQTDDERKVRNMSLWDEFWRWASQWMKY